MNEAVLRILQGDRLCPPQVSSVAFVMGVIASLVSHGSEPPAARAIHQEIDESDAVALSVEDEVVAADLVREFLARLEDDDLRRYVELLAVRGPTSAEDAAKLFGVEVKDVRNWNKRLRRLRPLWG